MTVNGSEPPLITLDLSRFDAAPSARLGHLSLEGDRAFPTCLIPGFDGVICSLEWKEALWDKFVTAAPRPRTPSERQYSDRKLRTLRKDGLDATSNTVRQ